MTSFSWCKQPDLQTMVVDKNQHLLKTGSPGCGGLRNYATSSKSCSKGRDVVDDSQGGACVFFFCVCVFFYFFFYMLFFLCLE